jgi:hypothetical protein
MVVRRRCTRPKRRTRCTRARARCAGRAQLGACPRPCARAHSHTWADAWAVRLLRYATANYTIATKGPQMEEDPSVEARMMRIENEYQTTGMRRTVEAVILTHDHRHPHILLLQIGGSFFKLYVRDAPCGAPHTQADRAARGRDRTRPGRATSCTLVRTRSKASSRVSTPC